MLKYLRHIKEANIPAMSAESLERLLPMLGMNNEELHEIPPELYDYCGGGLRFWQYPNQFSKYLKQILRYQNINAYLEIGCRWGGTFIITSEILKLNNPDIDLYACDIIDMSEQMQDYAHFQAFHYLNKSSHDLCRSDFRSDVDLILIDGFHTYEGVSKDFEISLTLNPKYIVLHDVCSDVCPGVVEFWNQIKHKYNRHYEFLEQYNSVAGSFLGIGLIEL